jgi:cysteinyl-tRNA synthetase
MGSEKMSKSLGNIVTPAELLKQGHRGEVLRLALMSAHYRQPLAWTDELLSQSKAVLDRWYRALGDVPSTQAGEFSNLWEALRDDLNTPKMVAEVNSILRSVEQGFDDDYRFYQGSENQKLEALAAFLREMGFLTMSKDEWFQGDGDAGDIEARIAARTEAKKNRDFTTADRIRDELKAEGIVLEDSASGTTRNERAALHDRDPAAGDVAPGAA